MFVTPLVSFFSLVSCASQVLGGLTSFQRSEVDPPGGQAVFDLHGSQLPPPNTTYYFDQLIDHDNPSLGTFKQRYWHNWEFYEKGGLLPVPI